MREPIVAEQGVKPSNPYSQGIIARGRTIYVSGQGSFSPETGLFVPGDFAAQAEQTFRNVEAILAAAGAGWQHVVKVNVYLADIGDFAAMNEVYRRFAVAPFPARTTVQAGLTGQMLIEVDCIATLPD
jgi:2-iminobutanoate/2-iminopropanoate deaminase